MAEASLPRSGSKVNARQLLRSGEHIEWRPIPGWPEYEVSEHGDVRRVAGGQGAQRNHVLRPWVNPKSGYLQLTLWRHNQRVQLTVHRLVALAFHGSPPTEKHSVAHNDGSRTNNHYTNLRWATQRENMADRVRHGTVNHGPRNGQAKLDEICVRAIRKMCAAGVRRKSAAEGFGVCRQAVDSIVNGHRWGYLK